jgi:regulator of protease activity HflC (stomatin/prohibitin superfamily)
MSFPIALLLQGDAGALPAFLGAFFLLFVGIVLLVIAVKTIRIVPQATVMLIERLGRFNRVAASGLNILWPFLDRPRGVYWTNNT